MTSPWVLPLGSAASDGWETTVTDRIDGWQHTGLYAGSLRGGDSRTLSLGSREIVVVPLAGSVNVHCVDAAGQEHDARLAGRPSVFAGPTDVAYLPRGSRMTITAAADCRIALAVAYLPEREESGSAGSVQFRHLATAGVPVELRGAGNASREVRNFAVPAVLDAEAIIACEVVTPGGNWSSYPPHKHDERRDGSESQLEEIYYFQVQHSGGRTAGEAAHGFGYQRVYGTEDRPIDALAEVHTGDVVLVPHGWHGPSIAAPGYDLYYLNVMAGPGPERAWLICDDPLHGWVRQTWTTQAIDPRLPMKGTR